MQDLTETPKCESTDGQIDRQTRPLRYMSTSCTLYIDSITHFRQLPQFFIIWHFNNNCSQKMMFLEMLSLGNDAC